MTDTNETDDRFDETIAFCYKRSSDHHDRWVFGPVAYHRPAWQLYGNRVPSPFWGSVDSEDRAIAVVEALNAAHGPLGDVPADEFGKNRVQSQPEDCVD